MAMQDQAWKGKRILSTIAGPQVKLKVFDQQNMHCCYFQTDQKKLTLSARFQIESAE